jgi:hypothetical protein
VKFQHHRRDVAGDEANAVESSESKATASPVSSPPNGVRRERKVSAPSIKDRSSTLSLSSTAETLVTPSSYWQLGTRKVRAAEVVGDQQENGSSEEKGGDREALNGDQRVRSLDFRFKLFAYRVW